MQFRDLKRQYSVLKEDIDKAMVDTATGGAYINGAAVKTLEQELAEYVGVRHCISCANGTDALSIALKVWGIGPGDVVFVPDFTFFSSAEVVAAEGALPVFVDVDPVTYNIDPQDLERRIEIVEREGAFKPRAIVTVDLFGLPADYDAIRGIADRHGLWILEDAAQGFGGSIRGRRACSFGDIATTSFFPAKPLGCYGDGGAIFTDNDEWAALAGSIKVHGKGTFKYDNVRIGMNSRLDTIQAAILLVKFHAFRDHELEAVNKAAAGLTERLRGLEWLVLPSVPEGFVSSWAQYTIQLREPLERSSLQAFLGSRDIPSMVYYPAGMHAQTAFASCEGQAGRDNRFGALPVSEELCRRVLSLPMHPYITDGELDAVAGAISEYSI
jgi:Predicted pyridoxal phosphate-dependent enzyme apparently involved in regulation of cell wall biogenesis